MVDAYHFLAGKRCLVLEDEFLISIDLQEVLELAGAKVVCFANAEEALALLRQNESFDVAMLDLRLGGRTGASTTVAAVLAERGTPFVFLTGMSAVDVRSGPFPQAPVVEKPYATERLMAALREALGEK